MYLLQQNPSKNPIFFYHHAPIKFAKLLILKPVYLPLQQFQEHGAVAAVHLGVVELEGDWECGLEPAFAVFAPHYHWVVELVCVLVYNAVKLCLNHCRSSHYHIILKEGTLTFCSGLRCKSMIRLNKLLNICGERDIT